MSPASSRHITRLDQIRILSSPLRQEIVDTLRAGGPSSAAELGELLGRPADSLYYHLRMLRDAALIQENERELANGRTEAEYRVPAKALELRYERDDAEAADAIARAMSAAVRLADRDFAAALRSGEARTRRARNTAGGRLTGRLSATELAELHEHLRGIQALMERSKKNRRGKLYAVTFVTNPLPTRPARRSRKDAES